MSVAIKILNADDPPSLITRVARLKQSGFDQSKAAHKPGSEGAVCVLKNEVGISIAVEVCGSNNVPGGIGHFWRAEESVVDQRGAVHEPDRHPSVAVL